MLVLSRHENESIIIGDNIVVEVLKISEDRVKLAIEAPKEVLILRSELIQEREAGEMA